MNFRGILFILLVVCLLSISAVSANDSISQDDNQTKYTFNNLQAEVDNTPEGSLLDLHQDYCGDDNCKIIINKNITIDGHGHTLNCLEKKNCSAFSSDTGNIILKNLNIVNCRNDLSYIGGSIYIAGTAQYTLENCSFENNWKADYGAVIYNGAQKALKIRNCRFSNNTVCEDGGAVYSYGEMIVENCIFLSNLAYFNGGAVYCKRNVEVNNSTFQSNTAYAFLPEYHRGGAIFSSATVNVENSTFKNNYAYTSGGAIYAMYVNIDLRQSSNSSFIENRVDDGNGGAIYALRNIRITNALFYANVAMVRGGAIMAENVSLSNCIFNANYVKNFDYPCSGGAIYATKVISDNSTFNNNHAAAGGAIFTDSIEFANSTTRFLNNHASDSGGAVTINKNTCNTFSKCVFINNYADYGGAIHATINSTLNIIGNVFLNNKSKSYGQTIYSFGKIGEIRDNYWKYSVANADNYQISLIDLLALRIVQETPIP